MLKQLISSLLILFISFQTFGQNASLDLQGIENKVINTSEHHHREIHFGFESLKKQNPLNILFGIPMFLYQKLISPQFSASCLYNPSCSSFSKKLISRYGIFKGVFLSADRLTRCNRLGAHDFEFFQIDPHDHKVHESVEIYSNKTKKLADK